MLQSKLSVFRITKRSAYKGALIGFVAGIIYSVGGLLIDILVSLTFLSPETMETSGLSYGTILAFGALIGMPIIFGFAGALIGLVGSFLQKKLSK